MGTYTKAGILILIEALGQTLTIEEMVKFHFERQLIRCGYVSVKVPLEEKKYKGHGWLQSPGYICWFGWFSL